MSNDRFVVSCVIINLSNIVALLRARRGDAFGNLRFWRTARNYMPAMATAAHTAIVDQVVEVDDALMEKYLAGEQPTPEKLHDAFEAALRMRAKARGMEMSAEVAQFILNRAPRDMNDLFDLLERLDVVSLQEQRKLTIPFVKHVFKQS